MKSQLRKRLLQAYAGESRQHLARLDRCLEALQEDPGAPRAEAQLGLHSLKGSSRVLGFPLVEEAAHQLEDLLDSPRPDWERLGQVRAELGARLEAVLTGRGPSQEVTWKPAPRVSSDRLADLLAQTEKLMLETLQLDGLCEELSPWASRHSEVARCWSRLDELCRSLRETARDLNEAARQGLLVAAGDLLGWLPGAVAELAQGEHKQVELVLEGQETQVEAALLEALEEPLMHLVRNAIRHGFESPEERSQAGKPRAGRLRISLRARPRRLVMVVEDDGRGLDIPSLRQRAPESAGPRELLELLFRPGFSLSEQVDEVAGRGLGLAAAREKVEQLGGHLDFLSAFSPGARVRLQVPSQLLAEGVLLVRAGEQTLGIPSRAIRLLRRVSPLYDDKPVILDEEGSSYPVQSLSRRLGVDCAPTSLWKVAMLDRVALVVDDWLGLREVVVRPLERSGFPLPHILGACTDPQGQACLVLNPSFLNQAVSGAEPMSAGSSPTPLVLLVEDSASVRLLVEGLLRDRGYRVRTARDGEEAWQYLRDHGPVDLVVTDWQMPRRDGMELLRCLKGDPATQAIPVVIFSSRGSSEERQQGLDLGAEAFLGKQDFAESELLEVVGRLAGPVR